MVSYSHVYDDPRVVPMALSLIQLGYQVQAIGIALRDGLPTNGNIQDFSIFLAPLVNQGKPIFLLLSLWRWLRGNPQELAILDRKANKFAALFFNLWILRIGLGQKPSAIHCHTHSPLPAAWALARWHRIPLVYDSCESVPDLLKQYPKTRMNQVVQYSEKILMPKADAVITVGERLAQSLRERGARQTVIIGNWKRLEDYAIDQSKIEEMRSKLSLTNDNVIVAYFGVLDPERSIQPLLQAVMNMPEVTLLISGHGVLIDDVILAAQNSPNIRWLGWLDMRLIPLYTQLADAVYYCLDPKISFQAYYSTPNKLFEAFAAGKPVVAQRGVGELSAILDQTGAGVLVDEVTSETLQSAFRQLGDTSFRAELQRRSLAAREQYSWGIAEQRLKKLYDALTELP